MSTPESKVRDPVVAWAKKHGFLHFRMSFRPGVRQGVPDDLFILPGGVCIFVEFKAPGRSPTPLQMHRLETLAQWGVASFWAANTDEAIAALQRARDAVTLIEAEGGAVN